MVLFESSYHTPLPQIRSGSTERVDVAMPLRDVSVLVLHFKRPFQKF